MGVKDRENLQRLVQFVSLAFVDKDIGEQYRDWKKEMSAGGQAPNGQNVNEINDSIA